jgi:hypothetical protein
MRIAMTKKRIFGISVSLGLFILVSLSLLMIKGKAARHNLSLTPSQAPTSEERRAKVTRSRHMPPESTIAITQIRNLNGKNWLQELEIEVQNNSLKPIYYINLVLSFPDIPARPFAGTSFRYLMEGIA